MNDHQILRRLIRANLLLAGAIADVLKESTTQTKGQEAAAEKLLEALLILDEAQRADGHESEKN